jgi:dUTP pyrophosphatase
MTCYRAMNHEIKVKVKYLRQTQRSGNILEYATQFSAGIDLRAFMEQEEILINPGSRHPFPTGICIEITTPGVAGFIYSRSGLGTKQGLVVSQGVGVVDPDYRGEIIVSLLNNSTEERLVKKSQRIAQLIFQPFLHAELIPADKLSNTQRGAGGFGHTGLL